MENILRIISNYALPALIVLAILLVWGFTLAAINASAKRRALPMLDRLFWLALGVVLPVVGYLLYLLSILAGWIISSQPQPDYAGIPDSAEIQPPGIPSPAILPPGSIPQHATPPPASAPQVFDTLPPPPIVQPTANPYLVTLVEGPSAGVQYVLENLPLSIGRGEAAHIRIAGDMRISRLHAEIYQQRTELRVRDLGSLHGTSVNNITTADSVIHAGDRISIGDSVLLVEHP